MERFFKILFETKIGSLETKYIYIVFKLESTASWLKHDEFKWPAIDSSHPTPFYAD